MKREKSFFKRPLVIVGFIIVIVIIVAILSSGGSKTAYQSATVARGNVVQEVSVTGTVKPVAEVELSFERSGRITQVLASVGETVSAGSVLVELDRTELVAQLAQADAQVETQQAKLDELRSGTRPEEIEVKRSELRTALQGLANDYAAVQDIVNDAYAKADDAVRSKTDAIFSDDETTSPQLTFQTTDSSGENAARYGRLLSRNELEAWRTELASIDVDSSPADLEAALVTAKRHLAVIRGFLLDTLDVVVGATGVLSTTIDTYKSNLYTARTNVITALTAVSDHEQAIAAQKIVVQRVQNELDLKLAGATADQLAAQEAQVKQASANSQSIRAQLAKTRLLSPFDGVVTKLDAKVGEIAGAGVSVVTVMSNKAFQIEANIPEADIAKVSVGDVARVTLDAYGSNVEFSASVVRIDPAETVIEGVSTYKTTLEFSKDDARIKSGMTANIDIVTDSRENVLTVPQWALQGTGDARAVQVKRGDRVSTATVVVGLKGSDGTVEVVSGLTEGETVVVETGQ
jgi:HlyD family secretion protein